MRIAIVIEQAFDPDAGGVQRSTSKLAKIFKENGHHVIIISLKINDEKIVFWDEIPVYQISVANKELHDIIESENISLILNQAGYSYRLTRLLINQLNKNVKIINTLRINPLNFYDNHQLLIRLYLKQKRLSFLNTLLVKKLTLLYHICKQRYELSYIIRNVDAFVMLSESFKPELYKLAPKLRKFNYKIYGINNPFVLPDYNYKEARKENVILHVGRLNISQKRVDLLLKIWQKLHNELPDWKFWVVGDGPERSFMEDFCKMNNLTNVNFFGQCKPDEYYKRAKIFHLTSAFEGFGNVLVEAQGYGCVPVLFNSYSAASEIIEDGKNGLLIPPFNIEQYVGATIKLIKSSERLQEMAINAIANVDRFSFQNTYIKWEAVFRYVTNEPVNK